MGLLVIFGTCLVLAIVSLCYDLGKFGIGAFMLLMFLILGVISLSLDLQKDYDASKQDYDVSKYEWVHSKTTIKDSDTAVYYKIKAIE